MYKNKKVDNFFITICVWHKLQGESHSTFQEVAQEIEALKPIEELTKRKVSNKGQECSEETSLVI
jgi:hypothetical protein